MDVRVGDRITIESNRVGGGQRTGTISEIVTSAVGNHYRVLWDDGRVTTFFPSTDATVEHATR